MRSQSLRGGTELVLLQVYGGDASVESEAALPVNAEQHSAFSWVFSDPEHVLAHHSNYFLDTLGEFYFSPVL